MTNDVKTEKMAELATIRQEADDLARDYNTAVLEEKFTGDIEKKLTEKVNEYTSVARTICFMECRDAADPMLEAITRLTFMSIAVKDDKAEGSETPVRTIVDKEKPIDLEKLHKFCDGIGADKSWLHQAEKFNMLLTAQKALDLGIDPTDVYDCYAMSEIAKSIDLGKNPTSKTNILKTMRAVVSAMVGEEYASKVLSHDVNFLMSVYSKKSRTALSVSCANHRYLRQYLAEICHRVVLDKAYEVDYKRAK